MLQPVYNNRHLLGHASTIKQAEKLIKKTIDVDKRSRLHVWQRDTSIIDLPAGFVYAISWGHFTH